MPNWVENHLIFNGNKDEIKRIFDVIQNNEKGIGSIDFNKIIPMPKELDIESGSEQSIGYSAYADSIKNVIPEGEYLKEHPEISKKMWEQGKRAYINKQKYGYTDWYEWSIDNWGTKWNADNYEQDINCVDNAEMFYQTAWSAPLPVIKALSEMFPNVAITIQFADEDLGQNCGEITYKNGETEKVYIPENQKEALEFASKVREEDLTGCGLYLNKSETNYVCIDIDEFQLVELFGKPALFTNETLTADDIPQMLNFYHLRSDDKLNKISTIEPYVKVNNAGTIITKESLDFGEKGYIAFNDKNAINFLGVEEITISDYIDENFDYEIEEDLDIDM